MTFNSFFSEPEWVTSDRIQEMFNQCQYYDKVVRGELHKRIWGYDNHLKRRQRKMLGEPVCTRSQIVLYYDSDGKPLAIVHQYKRRNGDIGGSGRPDPKRLFVAGNIMAVKEIP